MTLENILNNLPDYAKDIKLNTSTILNNHSIMSNEQFYGTLLATSIASRNLALIKAIQEEVSKYLDDSNINGAKAAAAVMAMNNIYYRFTHLTDDVEYRKLPAGLRMNMIREHGVNNIDFELWSLAVSIINGCGMCVNAHMKQLSNAGISRDIIQFTAKIAGIIHALAVTQETL